MEQLRLNLPESFAKGRAPGARKSDSRHKAHGSHHARQQGDIER
jgi:hypothetical protein